MSEQSPFSADLSHEGQFAMERRGYSRMQVDEAVAQLRLEMRGLVDSRRDLEDRLSRALDEGERLKLELSAARSTGRPPHQEISERIGQILKLADDEAKSQRTKADEEIAKLRTEAQAETTKLRGDAQAETTKLRADAKVETDRSRAAAQEQAERMLSAAQEQAETTVATAKAEAESTRKSAAAEAQQVISEATKQADTTLATAKSQAKQQLDEATARATAIHDGAERRLNLLMSRHTETLRRLTEIRDVVTSLVAGEADRGSLEDEVARIVAGAVSGEGQPGTRPGNGRNASAAADGGRHAGGNGQPDGQPALSTAQRPGLPGSAASAPGTARPGSSLGAAPGNGQREARPQTSRASALQAGPASGSAVPGTPSDIADVLQAAPASSGHTAPAGASILPVEPPRSPAQVPSVGPQASPAGHHTAAARPAGRVEREVDETATDLKIIKD
jgi:cell division septum initiation protein DivIVA